MSERVIVCGGRFYTDRDTVSRSLDTLHASRGIECIIEGGCRSRDEKGNVLDVGADFYAADWAQRNLAPDALITEPAKWKQYGKRAGPIRNSEMLRYNPSLVIAFPGGRGTEDMVTKAQRAGIEVWRIDAPARSAVSHEPT